MVLYYTGGGSTYSLFVDYFALNKMFGSHYFSLYHWKIVWCKVHADNKKVESSKNEFFNLRKFAFSMNNNANQVWFNL